MTPTALAAVHVLALFTPAAVLLLWQWWKIVKIFRD